MVPSPVVPRIPKRLLPERDSGGHSLLLQLRCLSQGASDVLLSPSPLCIKSNCTTPARHYQLKTTSLALSKDTDTVLYVFVTPVSALSEFTFHPHVCILPDSTTVPCGEKRVIPSNLSSICLMQFFFEHQVETNV